MRSARLTLALTSFTISLFAADPTIGMWKLNLAKSKLRDPSLSSSTMVIEQVDDQTRRVTFTRVAKDGETRKTEEVRTCDGKERQSTVFPGAMISCSGIGTSNSRTTWTKDGKQLQELRGKVSVDGKTMTNIVKGVDDKGNRFEETRVWDKE